MPNQIIWLPWGTPVELKGVLPTKAQRSVY